MKSEITEFSYGFALINELIGMKSLSAAPIFPSLIEEGRDGGGYDVKLDYPGVPLFLQFKRSDYMKGPRAKEYQAVVDSGGDLKRPYYRFPITKASISDQHELLLALDNGSNFVFYVAPSFHKMSEFNKAWHQKEVIQRSLFVEPSKIGSLDDQGHRVAFDDTNVWLCSEPRKIDGALNSQKLEKNIIDHLTRNTQPLSEQLPSLKNQMEVAEKVGREKAKSYRSISDQADYSVMGPPDEIVPKAESIIDDTPLDLRESHPLDEDKIILRQMADVASYVFNTQMIIVQPSGPAG